MVVDSSQLLTIKNCDYILIQDCDLPEPTIDPRVLKFAGVMPAATGDKIPQEVGWG